MGASACDLSSVEEMIHKGVKSCRGGVEGTNQIEYAYLVAFEVFNTNLLLDRRKVTFLSTCCPHLPECVDSFSAHFATGGSYAIM